MTTQLRLHETQSGEALRIYLVRACSRLCRLAAGTRASGNDRHEAGRLANQSPNQRDGQIGVHSAVPPVAVPLSCTGEFGIGTSTVTESRKGGCDAFVLVGAPQHWGQCNDCECQDGGVDEGVDQPLALAQAQQAGRPAVDRLGRVGLLLIAAGYRFRGCLRRCVAGWGVHRTLRARLPVHPRECVIASLRFSRTSRRIASMPSENSIDTEQEVPQNTGRMRSTQGVHSVNARTFHA